MNNEKLILGFVSPSGKFYECLPFGHFKLANQLLGELYKTQDINPVDKLCRLGWIVLKTDFVGFVDDNLHNIRPLSKPQKQWLSENRIYMPISQRLLLNTCLEIDEMLYGIS